ncbi:F0F1 ATP synthase subunit gamma [Candidatus Dependentiae bacterium]|nr:F0F1 ATP synthase subunit gamma [Candidatus Dependentiae bacterium]
MSQLIHLKQRIKTIGAIRKITQTMRLISMSSHSKLKKQTENMLRFRNEVRPLLCALSQNNPKEELQHPPKFKTLYILFAAEKGLCGTFNTNMFAYFHKHLTHEKLENSHIITVGKKASEYLKQIQVKPLYEFDKAMPNQLEKIAQDIYERVIHIHKHYEYVICMYSFPKTFFTQEAETVQIIPIQDDPCDIETKITLDEYEWHQNHKDVTKAMFQILLKTNILLVLSSSMLSEQSARFLSMDNATRSAETLLKEMKLALNKLRQAKITRELIELISSF